MSLTIIEIFNLALQNHQKKNYQVAIDYYNEVLKVEPKHLDTYNNLGAVFHVLGDNKKAISYIEKVIEIDPKHVEANNNLGVLSQKLGEHQKAISCYEKVIEIDPKHIEAHSNLGAAYADLGKQQKAIDYLEKAKVLKPDHTISLYNLGVALYSSKQYKKASEQFKLINFKDSKSYLLGCLYELDDKATFFQELDEITKQEETNAIIGSLSSRSEIKYGIKRSNPFCNDPLKYALNTNLIEQYDFKNIFVEPIKDILKEGTLPSRRQDLLTNGYQTTGSLFSLKNDSLEKIKNIIRLEVEKYKEHFKESKEGFIKNWPNSYSIKGWLIAMKSGGKLSPHMHERGWLSGSIYINVPPKLKTDRGNLVACIDNQEPELEQNKEQRKVMDVVTGSLCLFPSSLYHYTIPFESEEERIVLAFDVIPK